MANYKNSYTTKENYIKQTIEGYKLWKFKAENSTGTDEEAC